MGGSSMKYRRKLFFYKKLFDTSSQATRLFNLAVWQNCSFQYNNCKEYKAILDSFNFKPEGINNETKIEDIPFIPTIAFKKNRLFSMPENKTFIKATSSGTKGIFSQIRFELSGLLCGLNMVIKTANFRRLLSLKPSHYVILGYKPHKQNQTAATKTAFGATFFTPALSRTYTLKFTGNNYEPDLEGVLKSVQKHSKSIFPTRFVGFASYLYFMLKLLDDKCIKLKLKKGSKIMIGGGWKQFYTQKVDKTKLYELAEKVLGISEENIIEFFSAVEHPILYCDCKNHHFHVPVYSKVIIRDVKTLEPLDYGKPGLVNFITPMVKATPVLSIMTDDLGIMHKGEDCGCTIDSPYFVILGRIGIGDIKTCAAGAAEMLKGAQK